MRSGVVVAVLTVIVTLNPAFGFVQVAQGGPVPANAVPFLSVREGQILVPVSIGGLGPWPFLLDTGSSRSAVSETLAAALHAPLVAQAALVTSTGTIVRPVARLTDVALGSARVDALLATLLPGEAVQRLGHNVAGLLGQDFLSRFNYTLDYRKHRLIWDDDESSGDRSGEMRLALRRSEGRVLVDVPQDGDGQGGSAVTFVPDSAADGLVLFNRAAADRLRASNAAMPGAGIASLNGERAATLVVIKRLQVGAAVLRDRPAVAITRAEPDAPEGDGLLPLHLFARVTFNNRDGYMVARPR